MLPFLFLLLVCSCGFLVFILYFTSALDYTKMVLYQNKVRKAQKKIAEENMQKAVEVAAEMAEVASSDGKAFCISHVDVGLDAAAVREAVLKVLERKVFSLFQLFTYNSLLPPLFFYTILVCGQGISAMVFSTDESTNKVVVCAGVPEKLDKGKGLEVSEWLTTALGPLKGRCGKGKAGLATGQVSSRTNR